MAEKTTIAAALQDKIDSKAAIKTAIEAKGVTVGNVLLSDYASKVAAISQDPSIPVGTGAHLVTFYDFDGKVLKRERVATGGNATAPDTPIHQYLTFAEWNNPYTNVQSDIDTGAIYNTTDGKTYLFITLTAVTGLAPTMNFKKSSTSLMTINWGDNSTSTSTTSGNQTVQHTYSSAGDYIITVDNSEGGTWSIGQGSNATSIVYGYARALTKIYIGANALLTVNCLYTYYSLKYISVGAADIGGNLTSTYLKWVNVKYMTNLFFSGITTLRKIIIPSTIDTIQASTFLNCILINQYIFLQTTPPTLVNTNAFTGISSICKIYVPDASVDAYKAATNWVTYADYIYPLSQKPQSDE